MKLSAAFLAATAALNLDDANLSVTTRWNAYTTEFGKEYTGSAKEAAFAAFQANDAIIQEHNAQHLSWTLGHNAFRY